MQISIKTLCLYFFFYLSNNLAGQTPNPLIDKKNTFDQERWVDSIYSKLSLEEKVGQLFMPMVFTERDSSHFYFTLDLVKKYKVGGLVFSLGGPVEQTKWLNAFQKESKVPLMTAMDAEWGVAMRLDSVMPFPWPMTLGAVKDSTLLRKIGKRMGMQEKRLGIHYSFGPTLDINTNPKNPIIGNRSYGSSPDRVIKQALAIMKGHHEAGVLTSGKHFPGHGDTSKDSHKTLPTISLSSERLKEVEFKPYRKLINNGLTSVMVAHLDVPSISEKGLPTSLSEDVIQNILKNDLNFKGLVVTDALNMKGVSEFSKVKNIDLMAFLAGHDVLVISNDIPKGISSILSAYKKGLISEERLSHSVKKVLMAKYKVGLNNYRPVKIDGLIQDLNKVEDIALNYKAYGEALTLLKNKNQVLPLNSNVNVGHIALGEDSSNIFEKQLKIYGKIKTINESNITEILSTTSDLDTIIVSFHRSNTTPYKAYKFSEKEISIISKLSEKKTLILDIFVKPYALLDIDHLKDIDAILVSYQNSDLSQQLSADAIFGAQSITGNLPVYISKSYPEGSGIQLSKLNRIGYALPEHLGFDPVLKEKIRLISESAIDSMMTPGIRTLVTRKGKIILDQAVGYHTYKKKQPVLRKDIYDLASLTKILATLPLVMQDVDQGKINFDTTISDLIPTWQRSNKSKITLKEMLSHQAYLTPWIPFYKKTLNSKGIPKKSFYKKKASKNFSIPVSPNLYLKSNYEKVIMDFIKESKLLNDSVSKYSDLPYYILKNYFENYSGKKYNQIVKERIFRPLGLNRIDYLPLIRFSKKEIVPTEVDNYFRFNELHGYVHDMGAAMQNGVGGHAGLFGDAYSVAALMQMYLQGGYYNRINLIKKSTIDSFNKSYYKKLYNRRGVGFDKPQLKGKHLSTFGDVPMNSFGHFGYTGTYAWADPAKEIIIVILANRTYPNDNFSFSENNVRTRIQEIVYESIIN